MAALHHGRRSILPTGLLDLYGCCLAVALTMLWRCQELLDFWKWRLGERWRQLASPKRFTQDVIEATLSCSVNTLTSLQACLVSVQQPSGASRRFGLGCVHYQLTAWNGTTPLSDPGAFQGFFSSQGS